MNMSEAVLHHDYYKPSSHGAFNFDSHGKPRCASIMPGVVCVGTDIGIVLNDSDKTTTIIIIIAAVEVIN